MKGITRMNYEPSETWPLSSLDQTQRAETKTVGKEYGEASENPLLSDEATIRILTNIKRTSYIGPRQCAVPVALVADLGKTHLGAEFIHHLPGIRGLELNEDA